MKKQEEKKKSEQRYVDILSNGGFKAFFGDENNKAEDNCQSELERTLYLLKNSKTMSKPPIWYDEGKYGKILETWEIEGFDENKRNKYDSDMNDEKRRLSELNTAIAKGRAEGVVEGKLEDAKNCKALGISVDVIVKITGLSEDIINSL